MSQQEIENKDSSEDAARIAKRSSAWKNQMFLLGASLVFGAVLFVFVQGFLSKEGINFSEMNTYVLLSSYFAVVVVGLVAFRVLGAHTQKISDLSARLDDQNQNLEALSHEREDAQKSLSGLKRNHEAVINAIDHVIFEVDDEGALTFINTAWRDLTGFDVDHSLEHSLEQYIHSDDQDRFRKDFETLHKGQEGKVSFYTQLRSENGTFVAVEVTMALVTLDGASQKQIIGTIHNVEQRRRAERALGEAEKKYRNIVENAAGGIYQLTPEGLYLSANQSLARILGYEAPEKLLRDIKNANEMVYTDTAKRAAFLKELKASQGVVHREVQVKVKDGRMIWVSENARAVRDENGEMLYIEGSIEDIDERKQAEIYIQQARVHSDMANRAKSEFIANMSHELRTPLNAIIGFSEMIKSEAFGALPDDKYKEYASDIHESGQGLLRVINDILDISKIDVGDRALNEDVFDMGECVQDCIQLLQHKIEANKMVMTVMLDGAPKVLAEEVAIKQIFMNLFSNALKFTPAGGRVTVSHQVNGNGALSISVTDTGIGLSEDEKQKALSSFGQVDTDLNRKGSGTGLGLTLVHSLAKLHGGDFELFSQKGIGTTATIILPAHRVREDGKKVSKPSSVKV